MLSAIPIFSTGVANDGTLLAGGTPDPHFALISAPYPSPQAFVFKMIPDTYVANGTTSQWIGPGVNDFDVLNPGDYTYRETFDLTGFDPSTVVIQGKLASDNDSKILLNGAPTGVSLVEGDVTSTSDFASLHPFVLNKGFVAGLNTLVVVVHNDYSVTGLRLDLAGTANSLSAPVLTSAIQGSGTTSVQGSLSGLPGQTYTVNFYSNTSTSPPFPGITPFSIGSTQVTADSTGLATIAAVIAPVFPIEVAPGQYIFARATASDGTISAYSAAEPVVALSDLSVRFVPPPVPTLAGSDSSLGLVLTNNGPSPATNVVLTETIPAGVTIDASSSTSGTVVITGGIARLELPALAVGASVTISLTVRPLHPGSLVASAQVTSGVLDPRPVDDTATVTFLVTAPPVILSGPVVIGLQRVGVGHQPTRFVLTFNRPLDAARAQNIANYQIVLPTRWGRFWPIAGSKVPVVSASYNPSNFTVTLTLGSRINLTQTIEVIARGDRPGGITDAAGRPLNAGADGRQIGPYRALVKGFRTILH
jgi:uncharacterized repeat protein (TIGR01451 family)